MDVLVLAKREVSLELNFPIFCEAKNANFWRSPHVCLIKCAVWGVSLGRHLVALSDDPFSFMAFMMKPQRPLSDHIQITVKNTENSFTVLERGTGPKQQGGVGYLWTKSLILSFQQSSPADCKKRAFSRNCKLLKLCATWPRPLAYPETHYYWFLSRISDTYKLTYGCAFTLGLQNSVCVMFIFTKYFVILLKPIWMHSIVRDFKKGQNVPSSQHSWLVLIWGSPVACVNV